MPPLDPPGPLDDSPVIAQLKGPPSQVARREQPWGLALGVVGVGALAAMVFASLNGERQARAQSAAKSVMAAPAAAPMTMPAPAAEPTPTPALAVPTDPAPADPVPDPAVRWRAPAMVVDLGEEGGGSPMALVSACLLGVL